MKLEFKKFEGNMDIASLFRKAGVFTVKKEPFVIAIITLIFIMIFGYLWYKYNYNYRWDEAERQAYTNSKKIGVDFDQANFDELLKDIDLRKENYDKKVENPVDIFRLKK